MKRTLLTLGLVASLVLVAAWPATAAPNNKNNADNVIPLECDEPIGDVSVRPQPGNGNPAWVVETGAHLVGKSFVSEDVVTVEIIEGGEGEETETFFNVQDKGASAPAVGREALVECTATFEIELGPLTLDDEFAANLNADFDTDIFKADQVVTISVVSTLTVQNLVTGP